MSNKIIVILFNLPWEWSTDYTNQTAFVLGKKNKVICYMWCDYLSLKEYIVKKKLPVLINKYSENIYLFYPILFIPFRRFKVIEYLNEKMNMILLHLFVFYLSLMNGIKDKVLWIFDPKTEPLIHNFNKSWTFLYDCVDYFIGTEKLESKRKIIQDLERKLAKESDLVTANSTVLHTHLKHIRKDVVLVPQGFRIDKFENYKVTNGLPKLKKADRPLIGFVGAVNYRIDYKLIYDLAEKNSEWDFAIWGPELQIDQLTEIQKKYLSKLKKRPNLIFGKSDKKEIPGIVKQFDIGMIPYIPDDDFNRYCYPMKLFEFFYVGIPVLSIKIEELKRFPNFVKMAHTPEAWEKIIKYFLSKPWPKSYKKLEKGFAVENSWENKIDLMTLNLKSI